MKNVTSLRSPRLRATLRVLRDSGGMGVTTRFVMLSTNSCNVAADMGDLRALGFGINCTLQGVTARGAKTYAYRLISEPKPVAA